MFVPSSAFDIAPQQRAQRQRQDTELYTRLVSQGKLHPRSFYEPLWRRKTQKPSLKRKKQQKKQQGPQSKRSRRQ